MTRHEYLDRVPKMLWPVRKPTNERSNRVLAVLLLDGYREGAQIVGNLRIFRHQRIDVANIDINRLYAGPLGARTEEPAAASDRKRGVERIGRNRELQQLDAASVLTLVPALW